MITKKPEQVLYGLRVFGIPTGLLTQEQVDKACREYQEREKRRNIEEYGIANPTDEEKIEHSLRLISRLKNKLKQIKSPGNFVYMYEGKHVSDGELCTSGLGGCLATLLYFEGERREGILTHYPPLDVDENIEKIEDLREINIKGKHTSQRGVILVGAFCDTSQILEAGIRTVFPGISLETITYNSEKVGEVRLNPALKQWSSDEHGVRSF